MRSATAEPELTFCQAVLMTARYQGAQCSRWRCPRHARQSATPVRHDSSATEYHNAYAVVPTLYAATYTASTGVSPMGQVKTPPRLESLQGDEAYSARDSQSTVNVFFVVYYTSSLGPPVGVQHLCTRLPCAIKGRRPLEKRQGPRKDLEAEDRLIHRPKSNTTLSGCRLLRSGGPNHSKSQVFLCSCSMSRSEE